MGRSPRSPATRQGGAETKSPLRAPVSRLASGVSEFSGMPKKNSREILMESPNVFGESSRTQYLKVFPVASSTPNELWWHKIKNYLFQHRLLIVFIGCTVFGGMIISSYRRPRAPFGLEASIDVLKFKQDEVDGLKRDVAQLKPIRERCDSLDNKFGTVEATLKRIEGELLAELKSANSKLQKTDQSLPQTDPPNNIENLHPQNNFETVDWAHAALGSSIDERFTSRGLNRDSMNLLLSKILDYLPAIYKQSARRAGKPSDIILGGRIAAKEGFVQTERLLPGYCFSFPGSTGNITINLATVVEVSHVQVEHVSRQASPVPSSAPKTIAVYVDKCSIDDRAINTKAPAVVCDDTTAAESNEKGCSQETPCWGRLRYDSAPSVFVGKFDFDYPNRASQTFTIDPGSVPKGPIPTRRVRFEVLENQGNADYTCVYRLKIYGRELKRGINEQI